MTVSIIDLYLVRFRVREERERDGVDAGEVGPLTKALGVTTVECYEGNWAICSASRLRRSCLLPDLVTGS